MRQYPFRELRKEFYESPELTPIIRGMYDTLLFISSLFLKVYECDSLFDYFRNFRSIKNRSIVRINGLYVDGTFDYDGGNDNVGVRLKDPDYRATINFLLFEHFGDKKADKKLVETVENLGIGDNVNIEFEHDVLSIKEPTFSDYIQNLISITRNHGGRNKDSEFIPPTRGSLDEIIVPT